jgi:hypothetical protein
MKIALVDKSNKIRAHMEDAQLMRNGLSAWGALCDVTPQQ